MEDRTIPNAELGIFLLAYRKKDGQVDKLKTRRFWNVIEGFKIGEAGCALRDAIVEHYKNSKKEFDWEALRDACKEEVSMLQGLYEEGKQTVIESLGLDNIKKGYEYAIFHIAQAEIKKGLEEQHAKADGFYRTETKELAGLELFKSRRAQGKKSRMKKAEPKGKKSLFRRGFSLRRVQEAEDVGGSTNAATNPNSSKFLQRFVSLRNVPTAQITTDDDDVEQLEIDLENARSKVESRNKMLATITEKIETLDDTLKPMRSALKIDQFTEFTREEELRFVSQHVLSTLDLDALKSPEQRRRTERAKTMSPEELAQYTAQEEQASSSETEVEDELSESLEGENESVNKRYRILYAIATGDQGRSLEVFQEYYGDQIAQYDLGVLFEKQKPETPNATSYLFRDIDAQKLKLHAVVFKLFDYLLELKKEQRMRYTSDKTTRKKDPTAKIDGLVSLLQNITNASTDVNSLTTYVGDILAGNAESALMQNRGPFGMFFVGSFFRKHHRYNPVQDKKVLVNSDTELRLCELYDELKSLQRYEVQQSVAVSPR